MLDYEDELDLSTDSMDVYAIQVQHDEVMYIEFDPKENCFYNSCGMQIIDIFDMITPNDLLLFRSDPFKHSYFQHRNQPQTLCKLYIITEEIQEAMSEIDTKPCTLEERNICWAMSDKRTFTNPPCNVCRMNYN